MKPNAETCVVSNALILIKIYIPYDMKNTQI